MNDNKGFMKCVITSQKAEREKRKIDVSENSDSREFNEQVKWQEMKCVKLTEPRDKHYIPRQCRSALGFQNAFIRKLSHCSICSNSTTVYGLTRPSSQTDVIFKFSSFPEDDNEQRQNSEKNKLFAPLFFPRFIRVV